MNRNPYDYLNPDNFTTDYDTRPDYASKQYAHGREIGEQFDYISISYRGVWSAGSYELDMHGPHCFSYETIGLHAHTSDLLRGFLDSGKPIWVFVWQPGEVSYRTEIHTGIVVHGLCADTPAICLMHKPSERVSIAA